MEQEELISALYAAASGRVDWKRPLDRLADFLNLWAVQVIGIDKATRALVFDEHGGPAAPEFALDYLRFYHRINPWIEPLLALPPDGWLHDHKLFDERFVAAHPFFKDFLLPYGGRHFSGTKLVDNDGVVILLGLMRGSGARPLGPDEMPFLQKLKHHLSEAFHNHMHLRQKFAQDQIAQHLLDPFPHAMLLVDATLGIRQRNAAARRLLASGGPLRERRGALACEDSECTARIVLAFHEMRSADADPIGLRRVVRLPQRDGQPLTLFISTIDPQHAMRALGSPIRFLVIAHDPSHRTQNTLDPMLLAECFGLTPAEARIAMAMAAGQDTREIAERHSTSIHTVRTQLRAVLEKTGTTRQADLVRLLLSLPLG